MRFKKTFSILLSLAVILPTAAVSAVTAGAEAEYTIASDCDDLDSNEWRVTFSGGVMSTDKHNKLQGTGSVAVDMPAEQTISAEVFAMMTKMEYKDAVDLNDWDYYEMCVYTEGEFKHDVVLQCNFIDPDVASEDGFNHIKALYDIIWENDEHTESHSEYKQNGWLRFSFTTDEIINTPQKLGSTSPDHICGMRISWLYYSNGAGAYDEVDWAFDGMIYYNQDFLDARTAAEEEFAPLIESTVVPTADNFDSVSEDAVKLMNSFNEKAQQYPNFMPSNYDKYVSICDGYYDHFKAQKVSDAQSLIASIGEINVDNYTEKAALVEQAKVMVDELDTLYGKNYELINKGFVTTVSESLKNCKVAKDFADLVAALPGADSLTLENKAAVEGARAAYKKLTDNQKTYVTDSVMNTLKADEAKIYELEHPYVLGQVDDDDKITASDALMALQFSVSKIELTDLKQKAADVDLTDGVSAGDALLILQYSVGKISSFPRSAA